MLARGAQTRQKMWPVYARAIEELFEGHLAVSEAQTLTRVLQRALEAGRAERRGGKDS